MPDKKKRCPNGSRRKPPKTGKCVKNSKLKNKQVKKKTSKKKCPKTKLIKTKTNKNINKKK